VALPLTAPARMTEKTIRAASEDVIYGDNSDKKINILDMILLKSYVNKENPKGFSISAADLDGDAPGDALGVPLLV
jgi:hypothetical protein